MAAMNSSNSIMKQLLTKVKADYPNITFVKGAAFCWSPEDKRITYKRLSKEVDAWSLLHELGHAILSHNTYQSDFELLKLEAAAWHAAEKLARHYDCLIDGDHIQDCLDTYRDWLHRRSTCPSCGARSLQKDTETYQCFNCLCIWKVSASRFCRPYRRLTDTNKKSPAGIRQATFV